jgi:hypothetical protein
MASSCGQAAFHPKCGKQALEHLGLCDNQIPGDLKSSNEGTQLNLLVGANRKSIPKRNHPKVRIRTVTMLAFV